MSSFSNEKMMQSKDELLVQCVRCYSHLYDHDNKDFRNATLKDDSWKKIAAVLQVPARKCQDKWNLLRKKFGIEKRLREQEVETGIPLGPRPVFQLYNSMQFLEKHVKKRRRAYITTLDAKQMLINPALSEPSDDYGSESSIEILARPQSNNTVKNGDLFVGPKSSTAGQIVIHPQPRAHPSEDSISNESAISPPTSSTVMTGQSYEAASSMKAENVGFEVEEIPWHASEMAQPRLAYDENAEQTYRIDRSFAALIAEELGALPEEIKRRKKRKIINILYESCDA